MVVFKLWPNFRLVVLMKVVLTKKRVVILKFHLQAESFKSLRKIG